MERILDGVFAQLDGIGSLDPPALLVELRALVQRTMVAFEPDGSWPDDAVLAEALEVIVGVADEAVVIDELSFEDQRWLDACRQCTRSPRLLADLLDDLRRDLPAGSGHAADVPTG